MGSMGTMVGGILLAIGSHAADAAILKGKVTNASGRPIAAATVRLLPRGLSGTTGADGAYAIETTTGIGSARHGVVVPRIEEGALLVPVVEAAPLKVEVFDTKGRRLISEAFSQASEGLYRRDLASCSKEARVLLVRVSIGPDATLLRHVVVDGSPRGRTEVLQGLARSAALSDTLEVAAKGYATRRVPVSTLDGTLDVVLDTVLAAGIPLGNLPRPSAGCGKAGSLKSGTYKITSAGLSREYILFVPDRYDPSKPSRLIFGMHWMNGSDEAVQGWSKWFGLQALDTARTTIFVAPNGYGTPPLWTQGTKDHAFFDDLVKLFDGGLCIDRSRIFSVGFSFGAMFTNSLAQTHQDVLRGVVVYSAADYNIYFPENTGKPLAYMGVHGLKDPTCPISAGRSSRDRFVKNNGCTVPATVPEAKAGGSYVTYDYKCPENLPVRWITFDGAHTYPPNNNGTWVHGKTWDFITRF